MATIVYAASQGIWTKKFTTQKHTDSALMFFGIKKKRTAITHQDVVMEAEEVMLRNKQSILLVLNYELSAEENPHNYKKIGQFTGSLKNTEDYFIYLLPYGDGES